MSYDRGLGTSLKSLKVPEHRPGFWDQLELRLDDIEVTRPRKAPKKYRRTPIALVAAVAALVVVWAVALPNPFTPVVLAYFYEEGTYTYDISYLEDHDPERVEAQGTLTYTVEEDLDAGTTTIEVQTEVFDVEVACGHSTCPEDLALFNNIPVVRYVADSTGVFVEALAPTEEEFPALVLPEPLPGSNLYVGLPLGFGPPFPDDALGVGDSWTTADPRSEDAGGQFSAEHTVVGQQTIAGRETLAITSHYQTQTDGGGFPVTSEATVWFDPTAGIIVRAELDRTISTTSGDQIGTFQIVVELLTGQ